MQDKKKGIFFSADALIALAIILIVVLVAFPIFEYSMIKTNVQQDTIVVLTSLTVSEFALTSVYLPVWISQGIINDTNVSLLKQISIFYVENRTNAKLLAGEVLKSLDTKDNIGIWYNNTLLASKNNTAYESSTKVDVARQTISGISGLGGNSSTGFSARAYLQSLRLVKYTYFGGYIGDGNITVFLREANPPATDVKMEGVINNNFEIYVNNESAGNFAKSSSEFKPSNYFIGKDNFSRSTYFGWNTYEHYLSYPESLYDMIEFRGNNLHIAGGFIKTEYSMTDAMPGPLRYYFPGIEGVINIYDGFYIPGNLSSMNVFLRINTNNYTSFLTMGNTTVYKGNTSGMQVITINNSQLLSYGLNYSQMSRTTVPLRIGMENISHSGDKKTAEVFSVVDLSGSMDDINKIDNAKIATKQLINVILNYPGNKVGLAGYETYAKKTDFNSLSNNGAQLNDLIDDFWDASGGTCICCGILKAINCYDAGIFLDNFNGQTVGSNPIGWNVNQNGVTFNITNEKCIKEF